MITHRPVMSKPYVITTEDGKKCSISKSHNQNYLQVVRPEKLTQHSFLTIHS